MTKLVAMTTTNSLEGYRILKYKGLVSVERYVGTGLKTQLKSSFDIFASLAGSDFKALSDKREELIERIKGDLAEKAVKLGANAIVGLDFESTAGDISTVHISANGTAVLVEPVNEAVAIDDTNDDIYSNYPVSRTNVTEPFTVTGILLEQAGDTFRAKIEIKSGQKIDAVLADIVFKDIFEREVRISEAGFINFEKVKRAWQSSCISISIPSEALRLLSEIIIKIDKYIIDGKLFSVSIEDLSEVDHSQPVNTLQDKFLNEIEGCRSIKEINAIAKEKKDAYELSPEVMELIESKFSSFKFYGIDNTQDTIEAIRLQIEKDRKEN